ncbi:54S ribosomal protein L41, mitochondrial [Erysiphe necator]|uniref:Large ribosomal subunit protein uL23m n=1 Tax=Uncinula necator TaxID=52586 RepID=A0A0B1P272_UNCNE|nr:54S ribosomal protein L41, mitochondrial [Erysiphe necator]KHJ31425.1 putative mitochondrial ribosomal [Erysiphe necator]
MATSISALGRKPPKLGNKKIYLPDFTITLLNTPHSPPTFASFIVPLKFNKLDMRDYLWNMYNVRCLDVRSYIIQQKIQFDRPNVIRPRREAYRPKAVKRMTIEMEQGFVWPEVGDLEKWDHKTFLASEKEQEEFQEQLKPQARRNPTKERESIAQQAKSLKESQLRREQILMTPENDLEEIEVEADVDVKRDIRDK